MNNLPKFRTAAVVLLVMVAHASAQDGCNDAKCKTDTVILNTGYNQASGTPYSAGQTDGYWQVVDAPNTTLTVPAPAWVIPAISAWDSLPNSGWISAFNNSSQNQNNDPPLKPYSFQRCFCTCDGVESIDINLQMLIDNYGDVYFDNTLIGSQTNTTTASFHNPAFVVHPAPIAVKPGKHCIRIDLRNNSGVAMGVDVVGTVTSASPKGAAVFLSPACCEPTGNGSNGTDGNPCADISTQKFICQPDGTYSYTFRVANNYGSGAISQILLTPAAGSTFTVSPQLLNLSPPLQSTQSTTEPVTISNVKPGDKVCFFVSLLADDAPCCNVQLCPPLPACAGGSSPSPPPARSKRRR